MIDLRDRRGQSTIEFLVTFPLIFAFVIYFFKSSLNFTRGYLAHYATFMASRTFLVYDNHRGDDTIAMIQAREAFKSTHIGHIGNQFTPDPNKLQFNSYPDVGSGGTGNIDPLFKGAYFDYMETFSYSDLFGGTDPLHLRSESFLGREPTRLGCLERICEAMKVLTGQGDCTNNYPITLSDNGC